MAIRPPLERPVYADRAVRFPLPDLKTVSIKENFLGSLLVNTFANELRKTNDMVDWMIRHGMHITGTSTPFDFLHCFSKFNTRKISSLIKQDVLLLAGENDHFVPTEFYYKQKEALVNARSVRGRLFEPRKVAVGTARLGTLI